MHQLVGYHRPTTVPEASRLLGGEHRCAVAGGTTVRHDGAGPPVEVVDLQALGLDGVTGGDASMCLGATARLQALVDHDDLPEVVRRAARMELPSALRTLATVGGTIGAGEAESVLLAALLAHDAVVRFADDREVPLPIVLDGGVRSGDLIVSVQVATNGRSTMAVTGRTPADTPIVAVVGRVTDGSIRLAITGVGAVPLLVAPDAIETLAPPGDFRGSSGYRRHLATVLSARVMAALS